MKKTRYVILGFLQDEELSGYDIKKFINIRMSFFWNESYGQIYPELSKMKEEGLIEQVMETDGHSRQEKTKYKITDQGRVEFEKWMAAENEKDSVRSEFLLKMFFATSVDADYMKQHILEFKGQADQKIALFQMFQQELMKDMETHQNHAQILKVIDLGLRQAQLYSEWSEEMLELYRK